ncbi:myeloid cell surface antigen CD33-like isoform X2 [Carcharodon carcharias]|uniref:myeloid cell surface antigen CD33-like isoform X2 n=1 Tax=Carcharodon carcharias TaxID=13397 RepID=UPI001B7ED57A|nr:myeloid cell surface antigen CD33-like isoform X2 [Carcharodon carcharias]
MKYLGVDNDREILLPPVTSPSYPSHLENRPRGGVWFNNENQIPWAPIAFHSKDHSHELPRFRHRTRLSGDLKDGDCSLIINNNTREDAGPYFFRIEFDNSNSYNYYPITRLHVSDFTDKPTIFPAEIIAGKRVDVSCTFNTTCNGTAAPVLTWDFPTDVPGSVSNTVTQHGVTLTYTSVLTLIPSLKHHGLTLSCRVRYSSVSSERTLVLTVQGRDASKWTVGLLTAGIMLSVFLAGIIIFICVRRRMTAMEERVSGTRDIALTPSPLSVKHQGKQNVLITEPRDTTRDTTRDGETPAPRGLSEDAVGGDAGHGNPDNPDDLLYANPQVFRVPSGDGTVHREEETEYAQIRFKRN